MTAFVAGPLGTRHTLGLARRSVLLTIRQPQAWVPSLAFPLLFAAINAAAFSRARMLPGFPAVDSYLTFLLPATVLQGVMFYATTAGNDMAIDIDNGFFERLLASPVRRISIVLGHLAGTSVASGAVALVFAVVLVAFGASIEAGVAGLAVLIATSLVLGVAIGAFAVTIALRTGSVEAVNGSFPIFFALIFLSSAFFPLDLAGGWFERVAVLNPVSWIVDGLRELIIGGWDTWAAARSLLVAAMLAVLTLVLSLSALRKRLAG